MTLKNLIDDRIIQIPIQEGRIHFTLGAFEFIVGKRVPPLTLPSGLDPDQIDGTEAVRLFVDHAYVSPLDYLRLIRLERARQSLEYGATVTRAAEVAGFRSGLQLRRAWSRQWGGSPRDAARAAATRSA